ncbi:MAG TPA: hypothetical protein VFO25_06765 [Candidatus Eremiobacteraceae bacterium]|nr:hypothetical protein [Candidatus Eremiobacteraceae bacterium]
MDSAQPAPAVTANANSSSKKPVQADAAFSRALSEGLNDVAFAFDGAFRPADSMSLAERAAYGLRSKEHTVSHRKASAPAHGVGAASPDRHRVHERAPRPFDAAPRAIHGDRIAIAVPAAAAVEEVRREARLRHASSSDALPDRARQGRFVGYSGLCTSAKVGQARLDVMVSGGGIASVMQWMR